MSRANIEVDMQLGVAKENQSGETRVALAPDTVKKLVKKGVRVVIESGAGAAAGFADSEYQEKGAEIADRAKALGSDIVVKIHPPTDEELKQLKSGHWLIGMLDPFQSDLQRYAASGINAISMELVPRTSRAQSMDVLSSQANIAGYRAVLEAAVQYPRFTSMMMTSAGMARPAKLIVLGAGVAGLQAIATARRLGAAVDAFDIRPEVKEQIQSLGAKFVEINVGESGTGTGGYAKELSADAKARQQAELTERLKKYDIVVSTANIPGRKAPVLVTEDAVKGMRQGSVIIDMAAASGGNCSLTEAGKVVVKHGVKIVGYTNYPALVPADASLFYGANVAALLELLVQKQDSSLVCVPNYDDDIVAATVVSHQGQMRWAPKK